MLSLGDEINGCRLESVLGAGGMGVVYKALQISLERHVALKVLASQYSDDEVFRQRFRREAKPQARLAHPNIVAVHDYGEVDGCIYLVMRMVDGQTLRRVIRYELLPPSRSLRLLGQLADAVKQNSNSPEQRALTTKTTRVAQPPGLPPPQPSNPHAPANPPARA